MARVSRIFANVQVYTHVPPRYPGYPLTSVCHTVYMGTVWTVAIVQIFWMSRISPSKLECDTKIAKISSISASTLNQIQASQGYPRHFCNDSQHCIYRYYPQNWMQYWYDKDLTHAEDRTPRSNVACVLDVTPAFVPFSIRSVQFNEVVGWFLPISEQSRD
jgi:hypothetical protein